MDVTVIIVTYNSEHLISSTLSSLPSCRQVIVVDNASTDSTCAIVESHPHPNLRLIRNATNAGFGAANNIALRQCETRYALILNPDAELSTDALTQLVSALESHPTAVMAGPMIVKPGKDKRRSKLKLRLYPVLHNRRPLFCGGLRFWVRRSRVVRDFTQSYETAFITGAIILYDLEKMPEVLYFDDDIFLYGEEDELQYRILSGGYKLLFVPYATGYHIGQASAGNIADEMGKIWTRTYYLGETLGILSVKYKTSAFSRNFEICKLFLWQGLYSLVGKKRKAFASKARRLGILAGYKKAKNKVV